VPDARTTEWTTDWTAVLQAAWAGIDAGPLAAAIATVVLAGTVRGFAGFGAALVMAPVLALLYGPPTAVTLMTVMEIPALVQVVRIARRETDWRRTAPMALASAAAIPLGALVLTNLDPDVLRRAISLIVLALVAAMASGRVPTIPRRRAGDLAAGATSGLMIGSTGLGGPPLILYYLAVGEAARRVRGDLFGFFLFTTLAGLVTFAAFGLVTPSTLVTGLALSLPYMAGMALGARLFPLADERSFRRLALILLTAIGAATLLT